MRLRPHNQDITTPTPTGKHRKPAKQIPASEAALRLVLAIAILAILTTIAIGLLT